MKTPTKRTFKNRHEIPYRSTTMHKPKYRSKKKYKYYTSKLWKSLRDEYITANPFCEMCLNRDICTPATEVHHIVPFLSGTTEEERWRLLLDYTNLMSLCHQCHSQIHKLKQ